MDESKKRSCRRRDRKTVKRVLVIRERRETITTK
jgi:hypothetical protein